jgi:hypothetical protein
VTNQIRVLSDAVNHMVVHVEGRKYPALVIQGDRLKAWKRLAESADADSLEILAQTLRDAVSWYGDVAKQPILGMGY